MALETVSPIAFLLGRILFGGVLAFTGLNHFMQADQMSSYAEMKGAPLPRLSVLASGALLVLSGVAIALGAVPIIAAVALVVFFVVVTPLMHDFWNADDPEVQEQEMTHFLKNGALAGGALIILAIGGTDWPLVLSLW
jgi:putative oxidoreductase